MRAAVAAAVAVAVAGLGVAEVGAGTAAVAVADFGVVAVGDGSRPCCRCGFGGCGNSRLRGVVGFGVVAVGAGRQLGVLLGALRFWGSWQGDSCHDPISRNALDAEIATTPFSTTGGMRRASWSQEASPNLRLLAWRYKDRSLGHLGGRSRTPNSRSALLDQLALGQLACPCAAIVANSGEHPFLGVRTLRPVPSLKSGIVKSNGTCADMVSRFIPDSMGQ